MPWIVTWSIKWIKKKNKHKLNFNVNVSGICLAKEKMYCAYVCVDNCVYTCVHVCSCVRVKMHTQPAQWEDPFSHQIFTSNHRLPAACCHSAHTLSCYGFLMYSVKKCPHKKLVFRVIFQVYAAQFLLSGTASHLDLDTANHSLECKKPAKQKTYAHTHTHILSSHCCWLAFGAGYVKMQMFGGARIKL